MSGIYIHIPFCRQSCHYCDFHFSVSLNKKEAFLEALNKEIALQKNYLQAEKDPVKTVYFGGGTPSLLSGEEIKKIIREISLYYPLSSVSEITLEANPDDLNPEKLNDLKEAGINRLSIGIQSFSDEDLKYMNRVHHARQALDAVKNAQAAGFSNITIDLIYGVPTLSNEQWKKNLAIAMELNVPHLSCYSLTIEPRTALARLINKGKTAAPDEQRSAEQFELLMQISEANGYEQYEISNFAKDGMYSLHNSSYWRGEKYLGLGPSAHSYNGVSRQWNKANNTLYIRSLPDDKIPFELETLTTKQHYNEYVLTALRTKWGCSLSYISKEFGEDFKIHFDQSSKKFIDQGWIEMKAGTYLLTQEGKFFADKIAAELFIV